VPGAGSSPPEPEPGGAKAMDKPRIRILATGECDGEGFAGKPKKNSGVLRGSDFQWMWRWEREAPNAALCFLWATSRGKRAGGGGARVILTVRIYRWISSAAFSRLWSDTAAE
jgi:hypothetical protein